VSFAGDEWFPSRLSFGKFKGRLYQEAVEDAELRAWLECLAESTNENSSTMGRWYLADVELEYGIVKSKADSVRSRLFIEPRQFYQERDFLRLLIQFRKAFIERLLSEGEEATNATAGDYQRKAAEKDREYDSTAAALKGKRELNSAEAGLLKQLWKKLVRMFHPDRHEQDPEKRKTYELLTQAINEARDRGDIELLQLIAKGSTGVHFETGLGKRFARR
jgi:hypothetical protein